MGSWSWNTTWQIKTIISPLPERLWPPNLRGGWPNRRICAFHFVEIRCAFCLYLQKGLEFFVIKFYSSSPSFKRNILRSLNLEFETSAHAQIAITHYSYYLQISWHDINLKLTLEIHFDKWSWLMNFNNLIRWPFLEMCSGM